MARTTEFEYRRLKRTGRCRGCGFSMEPGVDVIEIPPKVNRPVTFICPDCVIDMHERLRDEEPNV